MGKLHAKPDDDSLSFKDKLELDLKKYEKSLLFPYLIDDA